MLNHSTSTVIRFVSGKLPENIKNNQFKPGECHNFEFYANEITPVRVIWTNYNISKYLKDMTSDPIFVDFEYVPARFQHPTAPPICIFTFKYSSSIYIFQQNSQIPNEQLKEFLSKQNGHHFVGFSLRDSIKRLKIMFGNDFSMNIEDVSKTRLIPNKIRVSFAELPDRFGDHILVKYNSRMREKNWYQKTLNFNFVAFTSFIVSFLSHCYDNFPPPSPMNPKNKRKIKKHEKIKFTEETPYESYMKMIWKYGEFHQIELFHGKFTKVGLFDADSDFDKYASIISKSGIIVADFRFANLTQMKTPLICLFTFGCSSDVYAFRQLKLEMNQKMKNFLSSKNGLKFIGKGINDSVERLKMYFGDDFEINYEDIDKTILIPNKISTKFNSMIKSVIENPCIDINQTKFIEWNRKEYNVAQVAFTALWSVAVYDIYMKYNQSLIDIDNNNYEDDNENEDDSYLENEEDEDYE